MVVPLPGIGSMGEATASAPASSATADTPRAPGKPAAPSTAAAEHGAATGSAPAAGLDRADIRPLDVSGALQILIAEVQLSLVEALSSASTVDPNVPVAAGSAAPGDASDPGNVGAVPAARVIVDLVLQSLPETFQPGSWSIALPRAEAALQAGVQSAMQTVAAWRDVPPGVVQAVGEAGALALNLIAEDPPYPLWPPPEWAGMAPRLGLFWRRRRALKRRLLDPDPGAAAEHEFHRKWDDPDDPG